MPEKYGVAVLESGLVAVASSLNVISKVLHKQGLWHLIGLQGPVQVLSTLDLGKAKLELLDLDDGERKGLELKFKASLDLVNKAVQVKVGEGIDYVEKVAALVEDGVDFGKKVYADGFEFYKRGKVLFDEGKALVGA